MKERKDRTLICFFSNPNTDLNHVSTVDKLFSKYLSNAVVVNMKTAAENTILRSKSVNSIFLNILKRYIKYKDT